MRTSTLLAALAVTLSAATASAQIPGLTLPQASPPATVSQTVGLTKMTIDYHRPAVNKRSVWGELVPYGEVWRAGANENTTITFSTPVKLDGKEVQAGTYGVHMIPTQKDWTVILSKMSVAWGSFTYDQKEDALRVTVTPRQSPAFQERLLYTFDDPTETSVIATLHWEKLQVPVKIEVNTPQVVMASIRGELRGLRQFNWQPWNQAARYWIRNGGDMAEAQRMLDRSLQANENFQNLTTRAMMADKKGDTKGAEAARAQALKVATEAEVNQYGYELLGQKKVDEAIAIFQRNVKQFPQSWNVHDSLGEAHLAKGDKKQAAAAYAKALSLVKDERNKKRIETTLANLKK